MPILYLQMQQPQYSLGKTAIACATLSWPPKLNLTQIPRQKQQPSLVEDVEKRPSYCYQLPTELSMNSLESKSESENITDSRRRQQSSFRKRCSTVFRKADELSLTCNADVYFLTRYRDRFYVYKSKTNAPWPPTEQQLVTNL